ncbi:uroporphyrinogen decarboxylase family protein [Eubacteriaceae bacterium ES3]|nr:uroporphyrinogen decarboxylase family protein [Eubacteriaceae bacterium ES3]
MSDVLALQQERGQLYSDFYSNIIPQRMPVGISFGQHIVAEYGEQNLFDFQFDYSLMADPARKLCEKVYSDSCPIAPANFLLSRTPSMYQLFGSQSFVMGNGGFVQHPEVVGMQDNEYDLLIEKGFDFLVETVIPRQHKNLDPANPILMATSIQMGKMAMQNDEAAFLPTFFELIQTHGYYMGSPLGSFNFTEAPMDFIADQLRSFSGISMDVRRHRTQLKEAADVMMPLLFHWGMPANVHPEGSVFIPLHMPTFMREKDFTEIYMPSYKKMLQQFAAAGARPNMFCEHDWSRYLDILLSEIPAGSQLAFEYGDPQTIKDKLGKKFILTGLFPSSALKTDTPEQIVDRAKAFLDIMLPGGGYIFGFDKNPLTLKEVNIETLAALAETMRDYGTFENVGQSFGTTLNSEGFKPDENLVPKPKSQYLFDWASFKAKYPLTTNFAKVNFERFSNETFDFYMNLLI